MENQQEIDRIVKKATAKYLKKLSEKEEELERYRTVLDEVGQILNEGFESYTEPQAKMPSSDEEIIAEAERILSIPENERSEEDIKLLGEISDKYGHALFNKDLNEVRGWAEENYDGDINGLIADEKFREYAHKSGGTLTDAVKAYVEQVKTQDAAKTPGSAKDNSAAAAKQYYSREEVSRMTPAQIKRHMAVIEKSMTRW